VGASPFWRGHWALVGSWHLLSFGKPDPAEAARQLLGAASAQASVNTLA
jgi:hypothetical protein